MENEKLAKRAYSELLVLLYNILIVLTVHGEIEDRDIEFLHVLHDL